MSDEDRALRERRDEAERIDEAQRRELSEARLNLSIATLGGTRLAGTASLGRYRLANAALELETERYFDWVGIGIHVGGLPNPAPLGGEFLYGRFEGWGAFRVARWGGSVPGAVSVAAGLGGEFGPAWFADEGRLYPLLRAKARWWLSSEVPLQVHYAALPAVMGREGLSMHEHRLQLGSGYSFFGFGTRLGFGFAQVDTSPRSYVHTELGAYLSFGVFE